ncbi:tripartite motif-containing protein 2-like [Ostrea edulis]|uniref:tripartite motif-containing protein 2-like n=1 Tax=Ostrea edulis TaxID=37623 RepID=UPI0020948F1B|nr:tripartite motif-containing protein 2-like [Ostrea edulis]XP_056003282.1 tripartite motif-containing protein 2-like [Ostrea edulis]
MEDNHIPCLLECDECEIEVGEFLCKSCPGYLCTRCKTQHAKRRITGHHLITRLSGKTSMKLLRHLTDKPEQTACVETDLEYQLGVRCLSTSKVLIFGNDREIRVVDDLGCSHASIATDTEVSPDGMAILPDKSILYSDIETRRILHVTEEKGSQTLVTTDWSPAGLCVTQSGHILVGLFQDSSYVTDQKGKVEEYTLSGSKVREITGEDQDLYSRPEYIAENYNRDVIVSDYNMKRIIAVNHRGQFRFSYSGGVTKNKSQQFLPMEIDTDTLGHVIIADQFRHSVHVIDKDGAFVLLLLTEAAGIKDPHGLCFDGVDSIWVAEQESRKVKRFKILEDR